MKTLLEHMLALIASMEERDEHGFGGWHWQEIAPGQTHPHLVGKSARRILVRDTGVPTGLVYYDAAPLTVDAQWVAEFSPLRLRIYLLCNMYAQYDVRRAISLVAGVLSKLHVHEDWEQEQNLSRAVRLLGHALELLLSDRFPPDEDHVELGADAPPGPIASGVSPG